MKRAAWPRFALSLLMGALVGPYWAALVGPRVAVEISALVVVLPASIAVLLNRETRRSAIALACVFGASLALLGFVALNTLDPGIWQGYTTIAGYFSLLAVILLAPAAVAFTLRAMPPRAQLRPAFESVVIIYALLAWTGLGVQNVALPYVVPSVELLGYIFVHHNVPPHGGGFGYGALPVLFVTLYAMVVWVIGFGLAAIEGVVVGVLLGRLPSEGAPPQGFN